MTGRTFTRLTPYLWVTQSDLYQTNSGVFLSAGAAVLIDPGILPAASQAIAQFVQEHDADVTAIILTHGHWDHILGPEQFPGVRVLAQAGYREVLRDHREDLQRQVASWEAERGYQRATPFEPPHPDEIFGESLAWPVGALTLQLQHSPGHAPDQITVYHAPQGTLWAGDMLSELEIPFVSHNLAAYEATLAQLAQLEIRTLIPGHGTPTQDPAEIGARLLEDRAYLAELRARVSLALQAGASSSETVAACAAMSYRHPEDNALPHRWNVESVYAELGGKCTSPNGWERE